MVRAVDISVGTLSKPFGLPGGAVGWIAGPEEMSRQCPATLRITFPRSPGKLNIARGAGVQSIARTSERNAGIITTNLQAAQLLASDYQSDILSWKLPCSGFSA